MRTENAQPRAGSGAMFDRIAHRYDLLNRVLSLGIDQSWRRKAVRSLGLGARGTRILDLATGTADLAIVAAERHQGVEVVGLDPAARMLERGRAKARRERLEDRIRFVAGDGEALPFSDRVFDGVTISFGIRNVPDRARALREIRRVMRPGGRLAILELSEPDGGVLGTVARFHVHTIVPWIGALLSGEREYRYLQRSIAAFPPAAEFARVMADAGLALVEFERLTFGVCHLYTAERPRE